AWNSIFVLGSTTDDACGEAFDKIAKYFSFGYPGGVAVDTLAKRGDAYAYDFPESRLPGDSHRYDVSYSGLKTAVVAQRERFRRPDAVESPENIAASFQRVAIDMVLRRLDRAILDTGIRQVAVSGGVASNSYLRRRLGEYEEVDIRIPPASLCTDNAAMIAAIGFEYLSAGQTVGLDVAVNARVDGYRRRR
ncbi:MAG: carbamoyltransferase N-terminal domain-containing protein, partial [Spirochaetia bacterium]